MTHNRILSIYGSKEDCIVILSEKRGAYPGVHLDTIAVKEKLSLKKICSDQKKKHTLQKGDYIIAIDYPTKFMFKKDYQADNLLHFASRLYFFKWLDETFA